MDAITSLLGWPLGWVMWLCYRLVGNYGVALLLFTIVIRLAMFPLSIKQQKSMAKMALLRPQMAELQEKYKNNKEKLNEEMMKLYQKEGTSPFSGCLPVLIQMPILFGLINVIYYPLKHILRLPADVIETGVGIFEKLSETTSRYAAQLGVVQGVKADPAAYSAMGAEAIAQIQSLNLDFLGIDLAATPSLGFNLLMLVPILSGVSALAMSIISMKFGANSADQAAGGGTMKGMMLMMPLMSAWIAFTVPAGVGIYWFYSNVIAIVQTLVLNKIYNPKEMAEQAKLELERRREEERQERIEAKKRAKELAKEKGGKVKIEDEKALTQKEINRRKLAEARKRDAEKYGEEYVEVTDEDLR